MAKNVIITENGNFKTISNATRIRTALEGGGTCDWIPKDDVPLQELTVTEDGVYDPEEGYYGFSQVTANGVGTVVEGTLIEKTVTKNGTYNITDESGNPYGYSKITVNVDTSDDDSGSGSGGSGSNPVVGKDEDGNDIMAETDDDGNIVMTALPTEIKVIIPPTKLDYNRYEEIDYSGISVYAYISKTIHWLGTTTTAVSEGSSNNIVSIGVNSVTASVGDGVLYAPDRTGANDIQLVWDGTKWVKPANYSAEKAVWKSDKYPSGKIPFDELIFPCKIMNTGLSYNQEIVSISSTLYPNLTVYPLSEIIVNLYSDFQSYFDRRTSYRSAGNNAMFAIYATGNGELHDAQALNFLTIIICTKDVVPTISYDSRTENYISASDEYAMSSDYHSIELSAKSTFINGRSISYYVNSVKGAYTHYDVSVASPGLDRMVQNRGNITDFDSKLMYVILYGDIKETRYVITLPVQWKRPGDGKILETTFTAWMKDDGGTSTSPEQSGGDQ